MSDGGNPKENFKLDLDAKEFILAAKNAKDAINGVADPSGILDLGKKILSLSPYIAAVGVAALTLKGIFESISEAEAINKINRQFETLSSNMGISALALKEGLDKAVGGIADDTDVMKSANKALVELGDQAKNIPQIMSLAKKATSVMGGELLQNFEALSQSFAAGNTRALKQMGIIIDSDAAYAKFAKSIGTTVAALTDAEKKQAVYNEAMQKAETIYKGSAPTYDSMGLSIKKIKVSFAELAEIGYKAIDRVFGPSVRTMMKSFADGLKSVATSFKAYFGDGAEQLDAQIEKIESSIAKFKAKMASDKEASKTKLVSTFTELELKENETNLQKLVDQLEELKAKKQAMEEESQAKADAGRTVDLEAVKLANAKKLEEAQKVSIKLQELTLSRIAAQEQVVQTTDEMEFLQGERLVAIRQQTEARLLEIQAQRDQQKIASQEEYELMRQEIIAKSEAQIIAIQQDADNKRLAALHNYTQANKESLTGIRAGLTEMGADASKKFKDVSTIGTNAAKGLSTGLNKAFTQMIDGSKSAGDALKEMFLNLIADEATARGSLLVLAGIGEFNPATVAAGVGLIALGAALKVAAGGGASKVPTPSGAASMGSPDSSTMSSAQETKPNIEEARKKRDVTLVVSGNYFETEQTKRTLMEMIRSETDATSFSYVQTGTGGA